MTIQNSFSSNLEVSRGLASMYAKLRDAIKQNDGGLPSGFSDSFTSADGLIKISISTVGLGMFAGQKLADGSEVKSSDIGIAMDTVQRSGNGPDDVTSSGSYISDPLHTVDDVNAQEQFTQQNFAITQFGDYRGLDVDNNGNPISQSSEEENTLADKFSALQNEAKLPASLQAKQDAANRLIDTLTQYINAHKNDGIFAITDSLKNPLGNSDHAKSQDSQDLSSNQLAAINVTIDIKV